VQVNEIALGAVLPPEGMSPQRVEQLARSSPARRLGALEEVAQLVEALIVNDFINGETVHLDGGRTGSRR
jgi:NAD(P)-dependent dehydrogenase (short-subunit alcohol dehydrogenase family)